MFELIWAWRLLFGQISPSDVPEQIRTKVLEIVKKLQDKEK